MAKLSRGRVHLPHEYEKRTLQRCGWCNQDTWVHEPTEYDAASDGDVSAAPGYCTKCHSTFYFIDFTRARIKQADGTIITKNAPNPTEHRSRAERLMFGTMGRADREKALKGFLGFLFFDPDAPMMSRQEVARNLRFGIVPWVSTYWKQEESRREKVRSGADEFHGATFGVRRNEKPVPPLTLPEGGTAAPELLLRGWMPDGMPDGEQPKHHYRAPKVLDTIEEPDGTKRRILAGRNTRHMDLSSTPYIRGGNSTNKKREADFVAQTLKDGNLSVPSRRTRAY